MNILNHNLLLPSAHATCAYPASPMRKLTEDELQAMTLLGRGRRSEFSKTLLSLAVGEALFLAKHERKKKYHPGDAMRRVGRTHGRKFELLADVNGTGWVVKRVG